MIATDQWRCVQAEIKKAEEEFREDYISGELTGRVEDKTNFESDFGESISDWLSREHTRIFSSGRAQPYRLSSDGSNGTSSS